MLLGIVSDSHDHLTHLEWALARFRREGVEAVIHPGDFVAPFAAKVLVREWTGPLVAVFGNNDGERAGLAKILPGVQNGPVLVEWGNRRISVDHYPPEPTRPPIPQADIVIFGHTHEPYQENRRGVLYLNPGECCGWVNGTPTAGLLDTESMTFELFRVERA